MSTVPMSNHLKEVQAEVRALLKEQGMRATAQRIAVLLILHEQKVPMNPRPAALPQDYAPLSRVARHRAVHEAVGSLLDDGIHALSVQAHTPAQWASRGGAVVPSPQCRGGSTKNT